MPAYGNFVRDKGYDLDAGQTLTKYRAVKEGTDPESVTPITIQGEDGLGVVQFGVTAAELLQGKGASVREEGITEWEAGAAVARSQYVTVDTAGRCIPASAGEVVWGRARQAASGSGKRIAVAITSVHSFFDTTLS